MSEYPEHIDQIDDYYRSQLADHEIEPPEGLWDKISLGAFDTPSAEAHAASPALLLTNTQKMIGLGAVILLMIAGIFYFYFSNPKETKPSENDSLPANEQPQNNPGKNGASADNVSSDKAIKNSSSSNKINQPIQESSSTKKINESLTTPLLEEPVVETKVEPVVIAPVVQEQTKVDSLAEIKTTQKAPKEKVKFKDKYKKDYQDSTRKIFVPGK
jgi:cytoskeletal protein RodZ